MERKNDTYKTSAPLKFDNELKVALSQRLALCDFVKYLRWYKDMSYLRFRVYDNRYKIIVDSSCPVIENLPVSNEGCWVINATCWFDNLDEIVDTIIDINNLDIKYYTNEELGKIAKYAEALNIDPIQLEYDYINRGDKGFSISHSDEFDEMIDDFTKKYMNHIHLVDGKFGVEYQTIKLMASITFDHQINDKERNI